MMLIIVRYTHGVLLFHTLAELLSILVGLLMFVVVVNTRHFIKNDFLLFLGIMYCAISLIDLMHAFTVTGMPFFNVPDGEITVHLWMYARTFEALILLYAPVLLTKSINQPLTIIIALSLVLISGLASFYIEFPKLFTDTGLSAYKIGGEFAVMGLFACAIVLYIKQRALFAPNVMYFLIGSLALKLIAEFCFTLYTDFNGFPFVLGHLVKFLSFWMIYMAIIKTALREPIKLLAQSSNSYDAIPISAIRVDERGVINQVNRAVNIEFSIPKEQLMFKPIHSLFHPHELIDQQCHYCEAIREHRLISNEEVYLSQYQCWFLISLSPVDQKNKSGGMVQSLTNISEQKHHELELKSYQVDLEKIVNSRTQELQESFDTLLKTQDKLLESKKMASLGGLVAGVSHEINTPIGVALTAASHLSLVTQELAEVCDNNKLTKDKLEAYLSDAQQSSRLMLSNLERASKLIGSFKKVAVDQSSEQLRRYAIKSYVQEVLTSLRPTLRQRHINIHFDTDNDFYIESSPSAIAQIITNLMMNALTHAFEMEDNGDISIDITRNNEQVDIMFKDLGKGISAANLSKIYEPFFTTSRSQGGSGLGMHIIFNLVNHALNGHIECESDLGVGTTFSINFPCVAQP